MKSLLTKKLLLASLIGGLISCGGGSQESSEPANSNNANQTPNTQTENTNNTDSNTNNTPQAGRTLASGVVTKRAANKLTVNGVEYDTSNANISVNGRDGNQQDLQMGRMVTVKAEVDDDGQAVATEIESEDTVIGPVENIDRTNNTLTIMGQQVLVSNETIFEGVTYEALAEQDVVEVSGIVNADGQIEASYIGTPDTTQAEFFVSGTISQLDTTALTFQINGLVISYANIGSSEAASELSDGMWIDVFGTLTQSDSGSPQLDALEIELEDDLFDDEEWNVVYLGGIVSSVQDNSFEIDGRTVIVDAETEFELGDFSLLKEDAYVELEGELNEDGSIQAHYLLIEPENEIELLATVDDIDLENNTVTVMGRTIQITENTMMTSDELNGWDEEWEDEHGEEWDEDLDEERDDDLDEERDDDLDEERDGELDEERDGELDEERDGELDEERDDELDEERDDELDEEYEYTSSLSLSDLNIGDSVYISAYAMDDTTTLKALYLERVPSDEADYIVITAPVDAILADSQTLEIFGQNVDLSTAGLEIYALPEEYDDFEDEVGFHCEDDYFDEEMDELSGDEEFFEDEDELFREEDECFDFDDEEFDRGEECLEAEDEFACEDEFFGDDEDEFNRDEDERSEDDLINDEDERPEDDEDESNRDDDERAEDDEDLFAEEMLTVEELLARLSAGDYVTIIGTNDSTITWEAVLVH